MRFLQIEHSFITINKDQTKEKTKYTAGFHRLFTKRAIEVFFL